MTSRPRRSTVALLALALALAIGAAALLLSSGHDPAPVDAEAPTSLSSSQATVARGQAIGRRFADAYAGYLNGTRDVDDLLAAGAGPQITRAIEQTPSRRSRADPPTHYAARDVQVRPRGAALALLATFVDGELRIPLSATMTRAGDGWQVTNFYAGDD